MLDRPVIYLDWDQSEAAAQTHKCKHWETFSQGLVRKTGCPLPSLRTVCHIWLEQISRLTWFTRFDPVETPGEQQEQVFTVERGRCSEVTTSPVDDVKVKGRERESSEGGVTPQRGGSSLCSHLAVFAGEPHTFGFSQCFVIFRLRILRVQHPAPVQAAVCHLLAVWDGETEGGRE